MIKPGDRIELLAMPDDPCPIEEGTRGTVISVHTSDYFKSTQISVDWDTNRSLMLVTPPDRYKVINE